MEEVEDESKNQQLIWTSSSSCHSDSMTSLTLGKLMTTLLSARTKHLHRALSRFQLSNPPTSLGSETLEDSLWFLYKYVADAARRKERMDEVLMPMIQHTSRSKNMRQCSQVLVILNWLFQDQCLFHSLATNLANIISRKEDRYVTLGWCLLVRELVECECAKNENPPSGLRDNYNSMLRILCPCVSDLSSIVCKGSTFQDGYELPTRLSVIAADCLLALTAAFSRKDMGGFLWYQLEDLINLVQKLSAWSRKSRPLHARGLEGVLRWLKDVKENFGSLPDEADSSIARNRELLLSSCWKHYGVLLHLEDRSFLQTHKEHLEEYLTGIQFIAQKPQSHFQNKDAGAEMRNFFLNCLCLLLGRLVGKRLESTLCEYGMRISQILIPQLNSADEGVVDEVLSIFRETILRPNHWSGSSLVAAEQMDSMLPLLLQLLDERDGAARAVVLLIAEYCSLSSDNRCLKEVLKRLASGNNLQKRNSIDVISELISKLSMTGNVLNHSAWQDISNYLLGCLGDKDITISKASSDILVIIEPSLVLPDLVRLLYSSDVELQKSARDTYIKVLKHHGQKPEVICMLLDCLSNLSSCMDKKVKGHTFEGQRVDADQVLQLTAEWSDNVQDWKVLAGPLIGKMFQEPSNAVIVRFLSYISEHLADVGDIVLYQILQQMQEQGEVDQDLLSKWMVRTSTDDESARTGKILFERLCPLLLIRLLPMRIFDDLDSSLMYGRCLYQSISHDEIAMDISKDEGVAALLLKRALSKSEFEDVKKLAAELCGRIHPKVLLPTICMQLERAAAHRDVPNIKACLFSICTSIVVRGRGTTLHPVMLKIGKLLEVILLWPSLDGDDVSKAQHGCIDCLALMICAELQSPASAEGSPARKITIGRVSSDSVVDCVIHQLIAHDEDTSTSDMRAEGTVETLGHLPFCLCMANVLISACQKIADSGKKSFAQKVIPALSNAVEVKVDPEIKVACVQVLFSAVYHLKTTVLPYSFDLLKLSLRLLKERTEKERMAGAKLLASLMAGEDPILMSISGGLLEAKSLLIGIVNSDPSPDLRRVCKELLMCFTTS